MDDEIPDEPLSVMTLSQLSRLVNFPLTDATRLLPSEEASSSGLSPIGQSTWFLAGTESDNGCS